MKIKILLPSKNLGCLGFWIGSFYLDFFVRPYFGFFCRWGSWTMRRRFASMVDPLWRIVLIFFGWIPERFLPWWNARITPRWRRWACHNRHRAVERIIVAVGVKGDTREAVIVRRFWCANCEQAIPGTWKGTMRKRRRIAIGNVMAPSTTWFKSGIMMRPRAGETRVP